MASIDLRIRRSTRRWNALWVKLESFARMNPGVDVSELRTQYKMHQLDELREYLRDEMLNMQQRFSAAMVYYGRITREQQRVFVKHLHMLTFDQTYRVGASLRIELLLKFCGEDEELLLREYARALEKAFPVESWSAHYVWNPKLVWRKRRSGVMRRTIRHHMSYRRTYERAGSQARLVEP